MEDITISGEVGCNIMENLFISNINGCNLSCKRQSYTCLVWKLKQSASSILHGR